MLDKNVICIKWGDKFGSEYVNSLYKMVEKKLTIPHRFVCFTDNPEGFMDGIEVRPLPVLNDEGLPEKAWKKLGLFTDELADLEGEALFLDLDVVIRDNIDCFFEKEGKDIRQRYKNEQAFLSHQMNDKGLLKYLQMK